MTPTKPPVAGVRSTPDIQPQSGAYINPWLRTRICTSIRRHSNGPERSTRYGVRTTQDVRRDGIEYRPLNASGWNQLRRKVIGGAHRLLTLYTEDSDHRLQRRLHLAAADGRRARKKQRGAAGRETG